ncbi:hypothetical protein [Streptomyces sp. Wb2n-11]|uniref:hypothetical protein n=1 Tax=Streptomyces sp. Wb2n-11 TaxID=1030533 RepID=UPI000AB8FCD3
MALPVPGHELYETELNGDELDGRTLLRLVKNGVPALSAAEAFDVFSAAAPEGWRVELIEGEIHVTPPADGEHEETVSEITGRARDHRKDLGRYTGIGLFLPGASKAARSSRM